MAADRTQQLEFEPGVDPELVGPNQDHATVSDKISDIVLTMPTGRLWWVGFGIAFALVMLLMVSLTYLLSKGVGIWGINIPVGWGFAIVNFVWWIGIGHAGTLISAILLLLRQQWRTSINRYAEAMTLFAVSCAGLFPIFHMGRSWIFYWLFPYPNTMQLWPQPRSPLEWDVFAVSTYFMVSVLFWYVGLIPDLATLRDRATKPWQKWIYGILAIGWRGSARHWHRHEMASLLLAGLATPLVLSVHTVVSFDFAVAQLPGWHTTIFPPYFVAGAVYSGFAMVVTLAIPVRWAMGLQNMITRKHLENMALMMLGTGWIVAYGYIMEILIGFYGGNQYEMFTIWNRWHGPYAPLYYLLWICNILTPQLFWIPKVRKNIWLLFVLSLVINVGMWLERFIIVITSLSRDFLPSSWYMYYPTFWDWSTFAGTIGLFLMLMFLFVRFLPLIAIFEMRHMVPPAAPLATEAEDRAEVKA